jgi:hypothetical protein
MKWLAPGLVLLALLAACGSGSGNADAGPVTCALGTMYGSVSCTFQFATCSDGHNYDVSCTGGGAPCTCQIDTKTVGTSTNNFCALMPDEIVAAVDSGCGWNIQLP